MKQNAATQPDPCDECGATPTVHFTSTGLEVWDRRDHYLCDKCYAGLFPEED